eukprot:scaffold9944_cov111-Isochrysis_galbana.AAC.1
MAVDKDHASPHDGSVDKLDRLVDERRDVLPRRVVQVKSFVFERRAAGVVVGAGHPGGIQHVSHAVRKEEGKVLRNGVGAEVQAVLDLGADAVEAAQLSHAVLVLVLTTWCSCLILKPWSDGAAPGREGGQVKREGRPSEKGRAEGDIESVLVGCSQSGLGSKIGVRCVGRGEDRSFGEGGYLFDGALGAETLHLVHVEAVARRSILGHSRRPAAPLTTAPRPAALRRRARHAPAHTQPRQRRFSFGTTPWCLSPCLLRPVRRKLLQPTQSDLGHRALHLRRISPRTRAERAKAYLWNRPPGPYGGSGRRRRVDGLRQCTEPAETNLGHRPLGLCRSRRGGQQPAQTYFWHAGGWRRRGTVAGACSRAGGVGEVGRLGGAGDGRDHCGHRHTAVDGLLIPVRQKLRQQVVARRRASVAAACNGGSCRRVVLPHPRVEGNQLGARAGVQVAGGPRRVVEQEPLQLEAFGQCHRLDEGDRVGSVPYVNVVRQRLAHVVALEGPARCHRLLRRRRQLRQGDRAHATAGQPAGPPARLAVCGRRLGSRVARVRVATPVDVQHHVALVRSKLAQALHPHRLILHLVCPPPHRKEAPHLEVASEGAGRRRIGRRVGKQLGQLEWTPFNRQVGSHCRQRSAAASAQQRQGSPNSVPKSGAWNCSE